MKIALLGYGRMGKAIEEIAKSRGHEISFAIGSSNIEETQKISKENTDVAIDFSVPDTAFELNILMQEKGIPTISGTTGWLENKTQVEEICKQNGGAFLYASNFSLGVNIFFEINKQLAKLMSNYPSYDIKTKEIHHIHKLDKPSGTAITLAEQIMEEQSKYQQWSLNEKETEKLWIDVERTGEVPGTHIINYENEIDQIEIKHRAINRQGFALGAVIASEWIKDKKGIFQMKDVLFD
ncbi:MAG: 4-hydroxy-tetrahydrodipicolinate reductase [Flavobacteriales bacterium]|jgi:4-hydroxy-tetrahydrodipicolinate reductase|nr:4-hydroxy-tetrahydrodipicolinate reductase [Flavobacteriales bacterium]